MAARQIKPKPVAAPSEYSDRAATESERSLAKEQTGQGRYLVLGVFFGLLILYFGQELPPPPFGRRGGQIGWVLLFLSIAVPIAIALYVRDSVYRSKLRDMVVGRMQTHYDLEKRREAETASNALTRVEMHFHQESALSTLHDQIRRTKTALVQAERLFEERVYTPFWDSVEDAVESLRRFDECISRINESAKEFYALLNGREHTFPPFPVKNSDLPNPDALIKRLGEIIAEAQRDFQFASIFEQRRTTSAIVTGFRNTQEAITSLRNDIVSSLSDLQDSLESGLENISSNIREGFDDLAASQKQSAAELRETLDGHAKAASERDTKHQKFTEAALDNIQNRRKPRLSETKEPFRPNDD